MTDTKLTIGIKSLNENSRLPTFSTKDAAGADLYACEDQDIYPGTIGLVKLGFAVELPKGYEMQIRPRSGLALKAGITVLNSPGTIDSDYRGEVGVIIANTGFSKNSDVFEIKKGDRIAQAVISKIPQVEYVSVETVEETERGEGGFGHTGVSA